MDGVFSGSSPSVAAEDQTLAIDILCSEVSSKAIPFDVNLAWTKRQFKQEVTAALRIPMDEYVLAKNAATFQSQFEAAADDVALRDIADMFVRGTTVVLRRKPAPAPQQQRQAPEHDMFTVEDQTLAIDILCSELSSKAIPFDVNLDWTKRQFKQEVTAKLQIPMDEYVLAKNAATFQSQFEAAADDVALRDIADMFVRGTTVVLRRKQAA